MVIVAILKSKIRDYRWSFMEADIFKESFKFFKKLAIDDVWNKAVDLSTGQTTREVGMSHHS